MEGAFDDIDIMFSEIELFLQSFPDDKNIDKASVELIVATFSAIESVIGFFVKSVRECLPFLILRRYDRVQPFWLLHSYSFQQ